ncbi:hypothetical protein V1525DRAFT_403535 [Lipomyces kononenkoae]|uniref:Uncharacterized protein n=1 Tax=Lipomyces kononenkoae TaxID=34357 RepID=A0ACC3T1L4_LIPKO
MFAMPPYAAQHHLGAAAAAAQAIQQSQPQLHHPQLPHHHQQQQPVNAGQPLIHQTQPPQQHPEPISFQDQFGSRYDIKRPHPPPPPPLHQQSQQHSQQPQQQQQQPPQLPPPSAAQQQQQQQLHQPGPPPSHPPASPSFAFDSLDQADLSAVGSASPAPGHMAKKPKPNPPVMNGQPLPQQVQPQLQQPPGQPGPPGPPGQPGSLPPSSAGVPQQTAQAQAKRPSSRATTWTKAEEERLRVLVELGTKWQAITKEFPNRTAGAIKKHYYADMKHTTWNPEEDAKLTEAVKEDEDQKWKRVAEKVGKPAKACEKRIKELMKLQQPGAV